MDVRHVNQDAVWITGGALTSRAEDTRGSPGAVRRAARRPGARARRSQGPRGAGAPRGLRRLSHRPLHGVRRRPSGYAPTVLGHEGAGVVEKVGADATLAEDEPLPRDPRAAEHAAEQGR